MAQTLEARLNPYVPQALSLYRIVFGFLFAYAGARAKNSRAALAKSVLVDRG